MSNFMIYISEYMSLYRLNTWKKALGICTVSLLLLLFVSTELLSGEDRENLLHVTGCSAELQTPSCQTDCLSERYRSITGECNNRSERTLTMHVSTEPTVPDPMRFVSSLLCDLFRQHPRWGAANIPYSRWLPPEYEDAWGTPRGWEPEHTYHNVSLPPV